MPTDHEALSASGDLTPEVGAAPDVAPLGRAHKPAHELTADEDRDPVDWTSVTRMPQFHALLSAKRRFVIPATIFFIVYYFALPVLVGYAPSFMSRKVIGVVNVAYLFALSQFFMAWIIAVVYLRAAARFDRMEHRVIEAASVPAAKN